MNQVTGTPAQPFMPLGEALMLADRYRGEGRLVEAEALCRRVLESAARNSWSTGHAAAAFHITRARTTTRRRAR
jgi:hypothetical protein